MRQKRRYIAFEIAEAEVTQWEVMQAIEHLLRSNLKLDRSMLRLIMYNRRFHSGLLRCAHKQVAELKAALVGVQKIGVKRASFSILGVSGTIKTARRKFLALSQAKG